jgi:hypothetical protein
MQDLDCNAEELNIPPFCFFVPYLATHSPIQTLFFHGMNDRIKSVRLMNVLVQRDVIDRCGRMFSIPLGTDIV